MCQSLLFKKQTSAQVVSSKFCEIFKNTFLQNTSRQLLVKVSKCGVFSGPYFPVFGLNLENDGVNLRIQSKYRKIRTSKNPAVGKFSRSDDLMHNDEKWSKSLKKSCLLFITMFKNKHWYPSIDNNICMTLMRVLLRILVFEESFNSKSLFLFDKLFAS